MTSKTEDRCVWPPVLKIQVSPSSMLTEATNHLKAQFAAQNHAFKAAKFLKVGDAPSLTYIYCLPRNHKSFAIAQVIHKHFEESGLGRGVKLSMTTGYTCCLANVRDLKKIDPDKTLVKGWSAVIGSQNAVIDYDTEVLNATATGSKPSTKDSEALVGGCSDMANEVALAPPTIVTNTEIDLWVNNIVGIDQSANSLSKIQANARLKFVEEMKWLEAVRQAQAMNLIRLPENCSYKNNMFSPLAKECGDRMRFLNGVIRTDNREVFVNVAKLLLKEEINVMTMIDRWSSNYKHEIQSLYSQELELREKLKAYRAEEHHRMLEFFSEFRVQSTTDTNASGSTEPLHTMKRLFSAKKATLDLKSVLTVEAANQALQKDVDSYESKVAELSCELYEAKSVVKTLECTICCHELDIATYAQAQYSSPRMRACFMPCFHASVCLDCALQIFDDTKKCPICNSQLTQRTGHIKALLRRPNPRAQDAIILQTVSVCNKVMDNQLGNSVTDKARYKPGVYYS